MPTLAELIVDLVEMDEQLDALGGEIPDDEMGRYIERKFDTLNGELTDKLDAYVSLIEQIDARADYRKQESKRLAERARVDENKAGFLRARLVDLFHARQWKKSYETPHYRVTLATAGGAQPLSIIDEVPDEYARLKTIREPDKDKIRAELECGKELGFARLCERKQYLKIS